MEIGNGDNFYLIEESTILVWGLDIPTREIEISNFLRKFILENNMSCGEVCEFNQTEDFELYSIICDIYIAKHR